LPLLTPDTVYFKDIQSTYLKPGESRNYKFNAVFRGVVNIKVLCDSPIIVGIAASKPEKHVIKGSKEFNYQVEPDTEIYVSIQCKKGLFAKPANTTIAIEMLAPKRVIEFYTKVKNVLSMISEAQEFYEVHKRTIRELLDDSVSVWHLLGEEARQVVKDLVLTVKKLDGDLAEKEYESIKYD